MPAPARGIRVSNDDWNPAETRAAAAGIPMTALVAALLRIYAAGTLDGELAAVDVRSQARRDAQALRVAADADAETGNAAAARHHISASTVSRLRDRAAEVLAEPDRHARALNAARRLPPDLDAR